MRSAKGAGRGVKEPEWWTEEHRGLYEALSQREGQEAAERWKKQVRKRYSLLPGAKLQELFALVNTPPPKKEDGFDRWAKRWSTLYTYFDTRRIDFPIVDNGKIVAYWREPLGPPTPAHELSTWAPALYEKARQFLEAFYDSLTTKGGGLSLPAVHYTEGVRYSLVQGGKVVHRYTSEDATSSFLFALGDLLAGLDDLPKIRRCQCGKFFFRIRRQEYCGPSCTRRAHPSGPRVARTRKNRSRWGKERKKLDAILADMEAIARKQKLQPPRSDRQIFEEAEKVLGTAAKAFKAAYPRNNGQGHEEGEALIAQTTDQIKRLGKRVKGY